MKRPTPWGWHQGRLILGRRSDEGQGFVGFGGVALEKIADELTERGVPTKTSKSNTWTNSAVVRILNRGAA